jgi:hypothetical protein
MLSARSAVLGRWRLEVISDFVPLDVRRGRGGRIILDHATNGIALGVVGRWLICDMMPNFAVISAGCPRGGRVGLWLGLNIGVLRLSVDLMIGAVTRFFLRAYGNIIVLSLWLMLLAMSFELC